MDEDKQTRRNLKALKFLLEQVKKENQTLQDSPFLRALPESHPIPGIVGSRALPKAAALVPEHDYAPDSAELPAQVFTQRCKAFYTVASSNWIHVHGRGRGRGLPLAFTQLNQEPVVCGGRPVAVGNLERNACTCHTTQDDEREETPDRETPSPENSPLFGRRRCESVFLKFSHMKSMDLGGLAAELQCSFCGSIPTPPPAICTAGHISCMHCLATKKIVQKTCPFEYEHHGLCGEFFNDGTSKLFEYLCTTYSYRFDCPYTEIGCLETRLRGCQIRRHMRTCEFRPIVTCPFFPCRDTKVSTLLMIRHMESHGVPIVEGGSYRLRTDYSIVDFDRRASMTSATQLRWVAQVLMFSGYYFSIVIETDDFSVAIWCSHMCDAITSEARKFNVRIKLCAQTGPASVSWEGEVQHRDTRFQAIVANKDCLSINIKALRHRFVFVSSNSMYWNTDVKIWERQELSATEAQLLPMNLPQPFPPCNPIIRIPGSIAAVPPGPVEAEVLDVQEVPLEQEQVTSICDASACDMSIALANQGLANKDIPANQFIPASEVVAAEGAIPEDEFFPASEVIPTTELLEAEELDTSKQSISISEMSSEDEFFPAEEFLEDYDGSRDYDFIPAEEFLPANQAAAVKEVIPAEELVHAKEDALVNEGLPALERTLATEDLSDGDEVISIDSADELYSGSSSEEDEEYNYHYMY